MDEAGVGCAVAGREAWASPGDAEGWEVWAIGWVTAGRVVWVSRCGAETRVAGSDRCGAETCEAGSDRCDAEARESWAGSAGEDAPAMGGSVASGDGARLGFRPGPENPYFNWSDDPAHPVVKQTDWGAMPAYDRPQVRQFFVDHAVSQATDLHFDGLRFDFTEPIKADWGGAADGWNMLRDINAALHAQNPNFFTTAEQFNYDPWMTKSLQDGGAGFDAQWFTEFNHRLVHDNGKPSLLQQAASGQKTDMDAFMNMLVNHVDGGGNSIGDWGHAVTVLSDHDEVGNATRIITVADGGEQGMPTQFARALARFSAGIALASPGIPMFFQGDESMAQNTFSWGDPSTWDTGWKWADLGKDWDWNHLQFNDAQKAVYQRLFALSPAQREADASYQALSTSDRKVFTDLAALAPDMREKAMLDITRRQTFRFYQDAIALRKSSPAFDADAEVSRVYTHNDDSVMAFSRKKGDDEFLVVGSLNQKDLQAYKMKLPPGQWKEVMNSDSSLYGGGNFGNFGATLNDANGGEIPVNLPAGGYVVFEKVG
jgi:1,4-alpha-glucan branching enzyme